MSRLKLITIADNLFMSIARPLEKTIDWVLPYTQYQNQLVDQAALMLTLSGRVSETQQVLASQTSFRLRTPDLNIEVRPPEPSAAFSHCAVHLTTILVLLNVLLHVKTERVCKF